MGVWLIFDQKFSLRLKFCAAAWWWSCHMGAMCRLKTYCFGPQSVRVVTGSLCHYTKHKSKHIKWRLYAMLLVLCICKTVSELCPWAISLNSWRLLQLSIKTWYGSVQCLKINIPAYSFNLTLYKKTMNILFS